MVDAFAMRVADLERGLGISRCVRVAHAARERELEDRGGDAMLRGREMTEPAL